MLQTRSKSIGWRRAPSIDALGWPSIAIAGLLYLAAALVMFGQPLLDGGTRQCICLGTDEGIFVWAFAWWPHAIVHGLNPFYSHIIYAPQGFDIALGALIPGAAILLAPVTAVAGPLFSYNVAMLLSPVLSAFFAFLLCRRITHRFWPSLFGGWIFGFSTYMVGELMGHTQLTLVFPVPLIIHLVLRGLAGELSRRRLTLGLTLALILQFSFGAEVFVTFTLFAAVAFVLALVLADERTRAQLKDILVPIGLAYAITAVVVAPYLYYAFQPGALPIVLARTNKFSNDLLSFVLPPADIKLGGTTFASTTSNFTAGFVEGGAYFGLPLLVMAVLGAWRRWRRLDGKVMVLTLVVVVVCSMGGHLAVNGKWAIPLPWAVGHRLPVLGQALPSRFVLYAFLIAGILAAVWLSEARVPVVPWVLAALSIVFLWPAIGTGYWRGTPDIPPLFTDAAYRGVIGSRDTALLVPVGGSGNSMLWQAEAGLRFKMASGYVVPPEAPDPYMHDPIYPTLTGGAPVPNEERAARSFLTSHGVTVAVVDPTSPLATPWLPLLKRLGWTARTVGGTVVLRPPAAGRE